MERLRHGEAKEGVCEPQACSCPGTALSRAWLLGLALSSRWAHFLPLPPLTTSRKPPGLLCSEPPHRCQPRPRPRPQRQHPSPGCGRALARGPQRGEGGLATCCPGQAGGAGVGRIGAFMPQPRLRVCCALARPGPPVPPPRQSPRCPPPLARLAAGPPRAGPGSHLLPTAAAAQWGPCERAAGGRRAAPPGPPRAQSPVVWGGCPGRAARSRTGRPHPRRAAAWPGPVPPAPGGSWPGTPLRRGWGLPGMHAEGPLQGVWP